MLRYLGRRLAWSIVVLLGVAILAFYLIHLIPGSPWDNRTGQRMFTNMQINPATLEILNQRYGLDKPVWQQFIVYLIGSQDEQGRFQCGLICGDMGPSLRQRGRTVDEILFEPPEGKSFWQSRFFYTFRLAFWVFIAATGFGIPLGVLAAVRQGSWVDRSISVITATSMAVPNFVIGLLAIIILASGLNWITIRPSWSHPQDWILPVLVLALAPAAMLARIARTATLEAAHGDYVRTARAKGLAEYQVVTVHILKNAALPIITYTGPLLIEFIAFSFVIEAMFGFPGFGREYYGAITNLDYSMIMGITMLYGFTIVFVNFFIDLLYGLLDPRIRITEI